MGQADKQVINIEKFSENLASFAIHRDDLKELIKSVPEGYSLNLTTIEYELQILKIISVGWAVSFYMPHSDNNKKKVSELYWLHIREVSKNISNLTETTTGQQINYFDILKKRLDHYVSVLQKASKATSETSAVIGSAFSNLCHSLDDPVAVLIGTKMFTLTIGAVKEYLNSVKFKKTKENNNEN